MTETLALTPPAVQTAEPLALYIHWPFCAAKCPYCDFNSHVRPGVDAARHGRALLAELEHEAARMREGAGRRRLASIFFGGGTPSLMPPEAVAALIARAQALFDAEPELEITLEANPTSVEAGKLREFRAAGVNRLSLGVHRYSVTSRVRAETRAAFAAYAGSLRRRKP